MTPQLPQPSATQTAYLYEKDYYLWLDNTLKLLKQEKLSELDIPNLIGEIADMGRNAKRAVYSTLKIVLMNLLKYKYQPQKRSNSWRFTLEEHRQRLAEATEESPSLRSYFTEIFGKCYQDARKLAAIETGLTLTDFPTESPFTPDETLNPDYLPNA